MFRSICVWLCGMCICIYRQVYMRSSGHSCIGFFKLLKLYLHLHPHMKHHMRSVFTYILIINQLVPANCLVNGNMTHNDLLNGYKHILQIVDCSTWVGWIPPSGRSGSRIPCSDLDICKLHRNVLNYQNQINLTYRVIVVTHFVIRHNCSKDHATNSRQQIILWKLHPWDLSHHHSSRAKIQMVDVTRGG